MKQILIAFAIVLAIILTACQHKESFKTVSSEVFEKIINSDSVQLVDTRTELEYSEGHIHRALNINVLNDKFDSIAKEFLSKDMAVAVYCKSGRRSKMAAVKLVKEGFRVYNLDKGIKGWTESGRSLEK